MRGVTGMVACVAACTAGASTAVLTFPELNSPPSLLVQDPFPPQPPLTVGTVTFPVPAGEHVIAAKISGFWGSSLIPEGTAGVNVMVDGILVAQCVKPAPECWEAGVGQRPWSHIFSPQELIALDDGVAKLTAVQTSDVAVRLGVSTLIVETAPIPVQTVPALSAAALLWLMAGLAVTGALFARRALR